MTETAITGISDEQLKALIGGRWEDDHSNLPGWQRWITVEDNDGRRWVRQSVFPSSRRLGKWSADSDDEHAWFSSLEEALRWCDDRTDDTEPPEWPTTKQEDRFAKAGG